MQEVIVHGRTFIRYQTAETIDRHIKDLAQRLQADFRDKDPLFVCIMNGSFMFAGELMREIDDNYEVAFARYSSYVGTESSHCLKEVMPVDQDLSGRTVLIIEDLIDTGYTMQCLRQRFLELGAREVYVVALFSKADAHSPDLEADYVAMFIDNRFILGHGLDYDGYGRMFKDLYQLKDE